LFPSEKLTTSLSKNNVMYRHIRPRLKTVGLEWVDFQVMRRTYSSLMREKGFDPKIVADLTLTYGSERASGCNSPGLLTRPLDLMGARWGMVFAES
jgi:hypothetical protein